MQKVSVVHESAERRLNEDEGVKGASSASFLQPFPEGKSLVTHRLPFLISLALFLFTSPVLAQEFYVGGGIGNTFFSSEFEDALEQIKKIDENATAWKAFAGFSPSRFLGLEGGYRSFGSVKSSLLDYESQTTAWDVEGLGLIRIAIFDAFGKAGAMFWKRETSIGSTSADTSATDFFWGLGVGVHLGPIGIRAEWESVVIGSPDNLSMVSLSGTFGF